MQAHQLLSRFILEIILTKIKSSRMAFLTESSQPVWGAKSWIYQDLLEVLAQTEAPKETSGTFIRGNNIAQVHHSTEGGRIYLLDGCCRVPVFFEFCSQTSSCDEDRRPTSDILIKLHLYSFHISHNQKTKPEAVILVEVWEELERAGTWVIEEALDVNNIETIKDQLRTCHLPKIDRDKWDRCDQSMVGESNSELSSLLNIMVESSDTGSGLDNRESWRGPGARLDDLVISDSQKLVLEKQTDPGSHKEEKFCRPAVRLGDLVISDSQLLALDKISDVKFAAKPETLHASDSLFSDTDPDLQFLSFKSSIEKDKGSNIGNLTTGSDCLVEGAIKEEGKSNSTQDMSVSSDEDIYIFNSQGKEKSKAYFEKILKQLKADMKCEDERSFETQISQDWSLPLSSSCESSQSSLSIGLPLKKSETNSHSNFAADTMCCQPIRELSQSQVKVESKVFNSTPLSYHGEESVGDTKVEDLKSVTPIQNVQTELVLGRHFNETSPHPNPETDKIQNDKDIVQNIKFHFFNPTPVALTESLCEKKLLDTTNRNSSPLKSTSFKSSLTSSSNFVNNESNNCTANLSSSNDILMETSRTSIEAPKSTTSFAGHTFSHSLPHCSTCYRSCNTCEEGISPHQTHGTCDGKCEAKDNRDETQSSLKLTKYNSSRERRVMLSPKSSRLGNQSCAGLSLRRQNQTVEIREVQSKDPRVAIIKVKDEAVLSFPDPPKLKKPCSNSSPWVSGFCGCEAECMLKFPSHNVEKGGQNINCVKRSRESCQERADRMRRKCQNYSGREAVCLYRQKQGLDIIHMVEDESFQSSPEAPGISVFPSAGLRSSHQIPSIVQPHQSLQSQADTEGNKSDECSDSQSEQSELSILSHCQGSFVNEAKESTSDSEKLLALSYVHCDSSSNCINSNSSGPNYESQGFSPQFAEIDEEENSQSLQFTKIKPLSFQETRNFDSEKSQLEVQSSNGINKVLQFVHYGKTMSDN